MSQIITANGSHKNPDALYPSDKDAVALGEAVETRVKQLEGDCVRIRGMALVFPASMRKEAALWWRMRQRHRRGDRRNSRTELLATRAMAQYTMDVNTSLRNQEPQTLEWKD